MPTLDLGERKAHRHRLLGPAGEAHVAAEPEHIPARRRQDELDLAVHLAAVEVAEPRLHLEPAVTRLEGWLQAQPVHRDGSDIFELHGLPQAERHLDAVRLRQARVSGRGVGFQVSVVEQAHDVALLLWLRLDRRFAADHEHVLGLEVRREVEAERGEVAVMRTEQASVQPDIGCEERAADAQHDSTRVVRPRKLRPVPH